MKVPAAGAGSRGGSPELVAWLRQLPKDADLERFLDSPGESLMLHDKNTKVSCKLD